MSNITNNLALAAPGIAGIVTFVAALAVRIHLFRQEAVR